MVLQFPGSPGPQSLLPLCLPLQHGAEIDTSAIPKGAWLLAILECQAQAERMTLGKD